MGWKENESEACRQLCEGIVKSPSFEWMTMLVVAANCLCLALREPGDSTRNDTLLALESFFLFLFVVEIVFKIGATKTFYGYFASWWNRLDLLAIFGQIALLIGQANFPGITVFRILRLVVPLRAMQRYPSIKAMIDSVARATPHLCSIMSVLLCISVIWTAIGVAAFQGLFYQRCYNAFGSLEIDTIPAGDLNLNLNLNLDLDLDLDLNLDLDLDLDLDLPLSIHHNHIPLVTGDSFYPALCRGKAWGGIVTDGSNNRDSGCVVGSVCADQALNPHHGYLHFDNALGGAVAVAILALEERAGMIYTYLAKTMPHEYMAIAATYCLACSAICGVIGALLSLSILKYHYSAFNAHARNKVSLFFTFSIL